MIEFKVTSMPYNLKSNVPERRSYDVFTRSYLYYVMLTRPYKALR